MLFLSFLVALSGALQAAIVVNGVQVTPSNCANDGTITINAQSGTSMLYAIIGGPDIRPPQSGNQFGGLTTGTYQIRITNFSNDTALTTATVGGTYQFPDFAPTFTNPTCPNSATGIIIGHALSGTGRAPYTWEITNTNTGVTTTQASDTFTGLPGGDYRLRLFDSCQGFATRYVTLTSPGSSFNIPQDIFYDMIACDTAVLQVLVYSSHNNFWSLPFIVEVHLGNIVKTDTFYPNLTSADLTWYLPDTIAGAGLGYGGYLTVTNGCGEVVYKPLSIDTWYPQVEFYPTTDSCIPRVRVSYSLSYNFFSHTNFHAPITMQVWDVTAGNVPVDSSVLLNNSGSYYPGNYTLEFNHYYRMTVQDECGNFTERFFTTPLLDTVSVYVSKDMDACLDSTATINIHCINYSPTTTWLTILSGPTISRSTTPYFQHQDTVVYPATGFIRYHCSGYAYNEVCFGVGGLPVGTYTYRVEDSCGHMKTDTFVITNDNIVAYSFSHNITRGCPGQNKINYVWRSTRNYTQQDFVRLFPMGSIVALDSIVSDSSGFTNLNAGSYVLESQINRYHNFDLINSSMPCNIVRDTIVVPPYQLPRIDYATQIKCNGTVNVGLQPDSSTGVPPYNYEILSGPQTAGVQPDNFFTLTQPGTYVARISDTCGFARAFTFTVDTLSFQQIVQVGSSCTGNTATLVSQPSPYATYIWQRPDGTFFTGDSLVLSPVTAADYGIYHIRKIVSVNLCRDTFYATYTLTSNSITHQYDTICRGQSFTFAGRTFTQSGLYYDTLATATCDSLVALHLAVVGGGVDSVSQTICSGQSVTVGTHVYTTAGIYRDTFSTAGCDSIHILNLHTTTGAVDSVSHTICYGQSVTVGPHTYSSTGIYRDTFATTGCDSIYILNLRVGAEQRDSVYRSICLGDSLAFGTHTYHTTGLYFDTVATANGCDSVHVLTLLVAAFKYDSLAATVCYGQSFTTGGFTFSATGIYRDTFATSTCDSIRVLNLTVLSPIKDSVVRSICSGQSITIGAHTYNATGVYTDTLTTALGCDSVFVLNLRVTGVLRDTASLAFCEGETVTLNGTAYTQPGFYSDTFATAYCDSVFTLQVITYPRPVVQITADANEVTAGDTVKLNATGSPVSVYNWLGDAVYSNTHIANPTATLLQAGWLALQVSDSNSCLAADSIYIGVRDCAESVFVPNAFTPNSDGNNDVFRIYGNCIQLNSLLVFNRWGEKMWETTDPEQSWNGMYKGTPQPMGVYVYVLNYSPLSAHHTQGRILKGSVTLIR